ncbi:MAG: protein kinase domain-containing protein [Pseudonocardiaceae bacterium]
MRLHPMHPAAWVLDELRGAGWSISNLLVFTRASTLVLASRNDGPPVVVKAGFGSNHVLAVLDEHERPAAYGFYWYQEMTAAERNLAREDFRHEIDTTSAATGAAHVVPALEEGSHADFDWYTMPYYPHGNFRPLLIAATVDRDTTTIATGLAALSDVATGLIELHQRGIVHRDVYQENILLHDGRGLITDLGAARYDSAPRGPDQRGPEVHWPPEYATNYATATPAADVFSLAVLAYRLTCADLPRLHSLHRMDRIPAPLREIVIGALAHDAADRPSMPELRDALRISANALAPST